MRIILTGIHFIYNNGHEEGFTDVELNFVTSGTTFDLNGPVIITKEDYLTAGGDVESLRLMVRDKVIEALQTVE